MFLLLFVAPQIKTKERHQESLKRTSYLTVTGYPQLLSRRSDICNEATSGKMLVTTFSSQPSTRHSTSTIPSPLIVLMPVSSSIPPASFLRSLFRMFLCKILCRFHELLTIFRVLFRNISSQWMLWFRVVNERSQCLDHLVSLCSGFPVLR